MKILLVFTLFLSATQIGSSAQAQECTVNYWEVIAETTACEVFHLPDFDFRQLPSSRSVDDPLRQFCKEYQVGSTYGKQKTGYCYTGAGERIGPYFRLGDPQWDFSQTTKKDRIYMADLSFSGCFKGKRTKGIVFVEYGWSKAPDYIKRDRRVEGVMANCEKRNSF